MSDKQLAVLCSFGILASVFIAAIGGIYRDTTMITVGICYFVFNLLITSANAREEDEDK